MEPSVSEIASPPCFRRQTSPHSFVGPGEDIFADWLMRLELMFDYEPYLYELVKTYETDENGRESVRIRKGFCPDFLLHATPDSPELHVEITGGHHRGGKVHRMILTREQYRIHSVLLIVGSRRWKQFERDPKELRRFLLRAGQRAKRLTQMYEVAA